MSKDITIYSAQGKPINETPETRSAQESIKRSWASYVSSLADLEKPAGVRAMDPFGSHVWVYAAVMAIAKNISQVPYCIYRETPDDKSTFRKRIIRAGRQRMAVPRFLQQNGRKQGRRIRGLQAEYDHPLAVVLNKPNPYMTANQLWALTIIYLQIDGGCFWLKMRADGTPVAPGEAPEILWPVSAKYFYPIRTRGSFFGYQMSVPMSQSGQIIKMPYDILEPHEYCLIRYIHPGDPMLWMSPLSAAAISVSTDMMAQTYNRAVLANGSKPGGILMHEDDVDEDEEQKLKSYWKQRHEGPGNANRMAIMTGNFKYIDIGLGPKDMEFLNMRQWSRDEIFAVFGATKSILGLSESLNYATQLSQDNNFWDKSLIPLIRLMEDSLDTDLFYEEPDDIVGAFDLTKVEALSAGLTEKIAQAVQLTGPQIHMPPKQALALVGIDAETYDGDDVAFITPNNIPAGEAAKNTAESVKPTGTGPGGSSQEPNQPEKPGDPRQPRPADEEVDANKQFIEISKRTLRDLAWNQIGTKEPMKLLDFKDSLVSALSIDLAPVLSDAMSLGMFANQVASAAVLVASTCDDKYSKLCRSSTLDLVMELATRRI